jgi:hypothetical protein
MTESIGALTLVHFHLSAPWPENWSFISSSVKIGLRFHPALYPIYIVVTFQEVKWQKREADNSLPYCDVLKTAPIRVQSMVPNGSNTGTVLFYFMPNT